MSVPDTGEIVIGSIRNIGNCTARSIIFQLDEEENKTQETGMGLKGILESNYVDLLPSQEKKAIDLPIIIFWGAALNLSGQKFLRLKLNVYFYDKRFRYTPRYALVCTNFRMVGHEELASGLYLEGRSWPSKQSIRSLKFRGFISRVKMKIRGYLDLL